MHRCGSRFESCTETAKDIEEGREYYDLVEVMICKTGFVGGAGQPYALIPRKRQRAEGLYEADCGAMIQNSEFKPGVHNLYAEGLAERAHELLHVHYHGSEN